MIKPLSFYRPLRIRGREGDAPVVPSLRSPTYSRHSSIHPYTAIVLETQPIRHSPALPPVSRVTRTLDNPPRVEVGVPRTVFTCVEPVPIYVTVQPPSRELFVEGGLRLRNIEAELMRIVRVADGTKTDESKSVDVDIPSDIDVMNPTARVPR
jgi:hypothetical protein